MTDPTQVLRQRIAEHRASVSARRARAYVDCPDYVMGRAHRPLSPATWTMLHATGNRLVVGGVPLEGDLRNYLWFHSPLFSLPRWFSARWLKWIALLPFSALLHRRRDPEWYAATLALAGAEIKALIAEALADAPAGNGRDCAPGPCLQAQFEHFCAERYGWSPAFTARQPLRRLFQLHRCLEAATDDDPEERALRYAHLRERNAAALAAAGNGTPTGSSAPAKSPQGDVCGTHPGPAAAGNGTPTGSSTQAERDQPPAP